jgi:hypothetical protein
VLSPPGPLSLSLSLLVTLTVETARVQDVWTEVSSQFSVRHGWVAGLQDTLAAVEADRQVIMRDTLSQLVAVVMDVASETPGVIERMVRACASSMRHVSIR